MSNGHIERPAIASAIQIVGLHKCEPQKIYQRVGTSTFVLIGNHFASLPSHAKPYELDYWNHAFLLHETSRGLEILGTPAGENWKESVFEEVSPNVKFVLYNQKAGNP